MKAGTTVTWINHDDDAHTVTSTANAFRSPGLDTDEKFSFTLHQPGTYEYFCTLHPLMTGKVVVTPERSGVMSDAGDGHELDRRGFLQCMAWAGTGLLWTVVGGVPGSRVLGPTGGPGRRDAGELQLRPDQRQPHRVQGRRTPTSPATLAGGDRADQRAADASPAFLIHTGDITHLSKAGAFDTVAEILKGVRPSASLLRPGEHDVFADGGKEYLNRFGQGTLGARLAQLRLRGRALRRARQRAQLQGRRRSAAWARSSSSGWSEDLRRSRAAPRSSSSPTSRSGRSIRSGAGSPRTARRRSAYLKRFGSVTVLNGHIHQILQKVEGNMTFHTARSTAFPQPAPGVGSGPGPIKVPVEELRGVLGVREVRYTAGRDRLAVVDTSLA